MRMSVWYRKMRHTIALHSQNRKELIIIKQHNNISSVVLPRNKTNIEAIDRTECVHRMALETAKQAAKQ